jgi:hypothetical protein
MGTSRIWGADVAKRRKGSKLDAKNAQNTRPKQSVPRNGMRSAAGDGEANRQPRDG